MQAQILLGTGARRMTIEPRGCIVGRASLAQKAGAWYSIIVAEQSRRARFAGQKGTVYMLYAILNAELGETMSALRSRLIELLVRCNVLAPVRCRVRER